MKWSALVLVAYLGFPCCLSLVKRIRPQEYLAIQSSCEKWFVIFINSWCWNTLLIDDFVFRLRSLLYNLEGVANIGVIDGVADAAFYNLFGYGGMQFVQLIDPPCSNVALLRNPNVRNLLPYFDPQKVTRELISLVGIYEQDGCKLQKFAVQEKIDTSAIFDSCHFWVVFETSKIDQSAYDRCYNDYLQLARHFEGDFRFAFVPTNKPTPGCLVSVYGLNKQQPTRFNLVSNGMASLYGVPSFLDEYRSRYRPCSTIPWKPVDLYNVMTSCKFWIVASVAQESDWPCVREIEKFAVYSKDNFDFGYIKGPTFGVWLFLENKLMPVLAMSDPTTCKVPAVFDIIKGQLNKVTPPPDQICDNFATTPLNDVDAIAILNQKKLMDSWENWIVLQSSPFSSNYPNMYNEFKNLFNQLKGSFRFGFMPNSQFGLWMYGSNKNWPYLITSDTNDFQSERYMAMLLDLMNGRGSNTAAAAPPSPYVGVPQNFGGIVQPQVPANGPFYPNTGGWNLGGTPQVDLYGSRSLESNNNDNSNDLKNKIPTEKAVTASPDESKNCNKSVSHGLGENKVYDGARGLDLAQTPADDGSGEEFILEPILNLTAFPEKWKAGLDELFSKSKDLVVRVSFPYPNRRKKTEPKNQVKPQSDADRAVGALPSLSPTSAMSETTLYSGNLSSLIDDGRSLNMSAPDEQTASITTEPPVNLATDSLIKQDTEGGNAMPASSVNQDNVSPTSGVEEISAITTENITKSVGGETETSANTAEISSDASSAVSTDMISLSPPSETSIATAERSADSANAISESLLPAETVTETTISTDSGVSAITELSISADGGISASDATEYVVTEASTEQIDGAALAISETANSGAREIGVESTVDTQAESTTAESSTQEPTTGESTTAESTTQDSTTAESTTLESTTAEPTTTAESTTAESTSAESTTAESTTAESTTAESTTAESTPAESTTEPNEPTSESTTEATQVETTLRPRRIETTDVETVRKDCKFWVLISSSETKEMDEKYETCYEKLTSIMNNYKNVYKFGAVQSGEFFINLYLRNKSNPIVITTDYACDEKKIKSALDAYVTENPGEFCQDPEDGPNLLTTLEPVTLATLSTRPTSTVAPDCSLQLVVRYPKKDAKKYQSCLGELSKVIKSKEAKWQLKEEDKPAFGVLLWTTTGVKPLTNFKLADCKADAIEKGINYVVTNSTPMCAYARG